MPVFPSCASTYFIGTGVFQTGSGDADFPISYVASDNVLGGRMAARALAQAIGEKGKVYVSNVKPGISTTDQREEGFKDEMKKYSGVKFSRPSSTMTMPTRPPPRCRPCLAACRIWPVFSVPTCSRLRHRQWRHPGGPGRQDQDRRLRRTGIDGPAQGWHLHTDHRPASRRNRIFRLHHSLRPCGNPVPTPSALALR